MNKKMKTLLGLLAFAVLITASVFAYNGLQNRVDPPDSLILMNTDADEEIPNALPPAYDFTVLDIDGNEVQLSDFFGKPIVLNFWTTWCPSCVRSSPYFEQLYREMSDEIHVLKVNLLDGQRETLQTVDRFISANDYTLPILFDMTGEASRAYGIRSIPDTVFINAEGYITARIIGAINEHTLQEGINSMN